MTAALSTEATKAGSAHRSDIDGLRALAIGLVVGFHASYPGFDGGYIGVDVFFVISGFLITTVLLRELDEHGRIRLGRFWARRIRRLLPASTVVVLGTLAATVLLLSPIAWQSTAESGAWAAAYAQNAFLAVEEADYFAPETRNPFVHFWSLAIEEQFYIVWPLVILALSRVAGALKRPGALTLGLGVLALASFVHSVDLTGAASTWDYYSPLSRGWEFAVGGLLAIAAPHLARFRSPTTSAAATAVGTMLILYSLATIDAFSPFPGWRAVPPVLGTALLIAAHNPGESLVGRLLDLPPVQWIGRMSYGWYLWHFPFLIVAEQYFDSFGPVRRLVVVLAALGVAWVSYHLVENPVRFSDRLKINNPANYVMAAGLLVVSLGVAWAVHERADSRLSEPRFVELQAAADDFERIADQGCPDVARGDALETTCVWGDPDGSTTLLVLGDSHADQWIPALDSVGEAEGIRILMRTTVACPALRGVPAARLRATCFESQVEHLDVVDEVEPDGVFVAQWTGSLIGLDQDLWTESVRGFGNALAERDVGLLWVHDPPTFGSNPLDCLAIRSESSCTPSRFPAASDSASQRDLVRTALGEIPFVEFDPVPSLCSDTTCALRIDGDLVYRDSNHLTGTTAAAFADELGPLILQAVGR